ncbi:MAG TPA: divalent-cation tolerance protein CutA [Oscillatoriaceae cyanobacterium]
MHLVFSTCPQDQATAIAERLVEARLAACCNCLPAISSVYWWEGKLTREEEALLIFKVPAARLEVMMARLAELHPYEVPEILAVPVSAGFAPYLAWVAAEATGS